MTKVVICWSNISGYMAACWRALAKCPGVEVFILGYEPSGPAPFDSQIMSGLRYRLLSQTDRYNQELISHIVREEKPDIVLVVGWFNAMYRALVRDPSLANAKLMMGMDTPWRGTLRQYLAPLRLRSYLRRFDTVLVPGERAFQYAIRLGIPEERIRRGLYGIDSARFAQAHGARLRQPDGWPREFLFGGRYCEDKGLDILVDAYRRYRAQTSEPWGLVCCGTGPMAGVLKGVEGLTDRGFVQPYDQADVYSRIGAFVLPSRSDPWPLVIVEACAAGLPIVCSNACGSAVELVRDTYNGFLAATGDAKSLSLALVRISQETSLSTMGERSSKLAQPYSADHWPRRAFGSMLDLHAR